MRAPLDVNRHRPLAPDALTSHYRTARHAPRQDDLEDIGAEYQDGYWDDEDDYWNPREAWTANDYLLFTAFEESVGSAIQQPKIGHFLPPALALGASAGDPPAPVEVRATPASDALGEALFAHVERLLARASSRVLALDGDLASALDRVNGGMRGVREAFARLRSRPTPLVMALLYAPFWVRPIATWPGLTSEENEVAVLVPSLLEHLFQMYPVPRALHQPWLGERPPGLKWTAWLILLGQGGNLHHAARRFGWTIAKRFTHCFAAAPADLGPVDAAMWAEVSRLGGDRRDFERLRRRPGYVLDPTAGQETLPAPAFAGEEPPSREEDRLREAVDLARTRAFWLETVSWLVRFRDALTDEASDSILEWALHLHTESLRPLNPPPPFSWRGREPGAALAAAQDYERERALMPYGNLTWSHHGLDWETGEGEAVAWTVRELTTSRALAEESGAMHHCVVTYAYRCSWGQSVIFSLRAAGERRVTIELDATGRLVQARGACNRAATPEEQAVMARWLAAVVSRSAP